MQIGLHKARLKIQNPILPWGFFVFVILFGPDGISQKTMQKSWEAHNFVRLEILSEEAYLIQIEVVPTKTIQLKTSVEGEHFESVVVDAIEKNNVLQLKTAYRPYFTPENDKLAAHKLISIALHLSIPEGMEVVVEASKARLETQGSFKQLDANLMTGLCILKGFKGNAALNARNGDVLVFAEPGVSGEGISHHGTVINQLPVQQPFRITAESVNGNISLLKSQE